MSVVCVDTQILIWAIMGSDKVDPELLVFAREFMKILDARSDKIIVPSIVVGEMLVPVEEGRVKHVLNQFKSDWRVVEYDLPCALQFAKMRRDHALTKRMKSLQDLEDCTRTELNADVMIIATAIANSADVIYSHDATLRKLADGWIETKDFLEEPIQRPMNLTDVNERE